MHVSRKASVIGKDGKHIVVDVPEAHIKMQIAYIANCDLDEKICLAEMEKAVPAYSKESVKNQYDSYKEVELADKEYEEEQELELKRKTEDLENTARKLQNLQNKVIRDKEDNEYRSESVNLTV